MSKYPLSRSDFPCLSVSLSLAGPEVCLESRFTHILKEHVCCTLQSCRAPGICFGVEAPTESFRLPIAAKDLKNPKIVTQIPLRTFLSMLISISNALPTHRTVAQHKNPKRKSAVQGDGIQSQGSVRSRLVWWHCCIESAA